MGVVGGSGMSAHHSGLYLNSVLFTDRGMNDISEFCDQVSHIGGPSRGLGWSGECQSGIKGDRRRWQGAFKGGRFCAVGQHGGSRNYGLWSLNESIN